MLTTLTTLIGRFIVLLLITRRTGRHALKSNQPRAQERNRRLFLDLAVSCAATGGRHVWTTDVILHVIKHCMKHNLKWCYSNAMGGCSVMQCNAMGGCSVVSLCAVFVLTSRHTLNTHTHTHTLSKHTKHTH